MTGRTRSARFQPKRPRCTAVLVLLLLAIPCAASAADKDPLRPPDTSSPRATLQGFVAATDDAYSRMAGVFRAYGESDRLYPSSEERKNQIAALRDAPKAMQYLDLSNIAPVLKDTIAIERLLQLKEVLDRIDIPAFADIPDAAGMAQLPSKRWRLPNTEIDIVLEVADAGLPANAGRWRLQASPGADGVKASCERTSAAADLDLSVQALGAGYLGSQIGQLAAAGQIRELTPGAVGRLSAAMSHDPAPWSCMIF